MSRAVIGVGLGLLALGVALGPSRGVSLAGEPADKAPPGTHPPLTLLEGRLRAGTGEAADEIADVTGYCSSCHEDAAEGAAAGTHSEGSAAKNHPADLVYPEHESGYRAREELAPSLLLLDGRMSCVTCHAHDDPEHGLVLAAEGSALCRACHRV